MLTLRGSATKRIKIPRWAKLKNEFYNAKHCIYCCGDKSECMCERIQQWSPDEWYGENTSITTWKKFLCLTGKIDHTIYDHANHLCRIHYRRIFKQKKLQICSISNSLDTPLGNCCDIVPTPDHINTAFQLEHGAVDFFAWICDQCTLCYTNDICLENQLTTDSQSHDPMTSQKSQLLLSTIEKLKTDGVIFIKEVLTLYKSILSNLNIPKGQHVKLSSLTKHHHYKILTPTTTTDASGKAIYDEKKFNAHSLHYVFKLKEDQWKKEKTCLSIEHLQDLIGKQVSLFPTSKDFDYTQLIDEESSIMELDKYFDPELFNLMNSITTSRNSSKHKSSPLYKDLHKSRLQMAISILSFIMNPQCCFLQTLTGLLCYALYYGLRDKGTKCRAVASAPVGQVLAGPTWSRFIAVGVVSHAHNNRFGWLI